MYIGFYKDFFFISLQVMKEVMWYGLQDYVQVYCIMQKGIFVNIMIIIIMIVMEICFF